MKKIYSAANLIEAQLMLDLLGHAGIKAHLLNHNAQGGLGDIPFAYPEVWIANDIDLERGQVVVSRYENSPIEAGSVFCSQCAEENPRNFQLCWHCGAGL